MHYLDYYFTVAPAYSSVLPTKPRPFSTWPLRWAYSLPPTSLKDPPHAWCFWVSWSTLTAWNFSPWRQTSWVNIWTPILVYLQQMSQKRTSVLDLQTELCLSGHPRRPQFSAPPYRPLHFSTPSTSPWIVKLVAILPDGSGFFLHYTWSPLDQIARFLTLHGCLWQSWLWHLLHGPLACWSLAPWTRDRSIQWQELYPIGGISGRERSLSSTATTKQ